METVHSLLHSQVPATCPYLSQLDLVHNLTSHFLKITAASRQSILLPQYVLRGIFNFALRLQANMLNDTLFVWPLL